MMSLFSFLPKTRKRPAQRSKQLQSFRPGVTELEPRLVPSSSHFNHVFHVTDGTTLTSTIQNANNLHGTTEIILNTQGTYDLSAAVTISANITIVARETGQADKFIIEPGSGVTDRVFDIVGTSNVTLRGVTIQGGSASGNGGGILVETAGAKVTLSDVVIQNNTASQDGGGVYVADGASLIISGSLILKNTADDDGGGVFFNASTHRASVVVTGTTFDGNSAGTSPGAGDGGGLLVQATAGSSSRPAAVSLTLLGVSLLNNTSQNDGGGVWAHNVTSLTAIGIYASSNTSVQDAGALGDSVDDLNGASFTFINGFVSSNKVTGPGSSTIPDGGGVCFDFMTSDARGNVRATLANTVFVSNTVAGAGGGMFLRDEASNSKFTAAVTRDVFIGNSTTNSNISGPENGEGGGLYVAGSAKSNTLTIADNLISGNSASTSGGGLYLRLDSGTALLTANIVLGNQAINGAGVYLAGNTDTSTTGGLITLIDDTLKSNSASSEGGGIYIDQTALVSLASVSVRENTASGSGGGVFNNNGTVRVRNSNVTNNSSPTTANFSGSFTDRGGNDIGS